MSQKDYVTGELKVKQKAVFRLDELYKSLTFWLKNYEYILQEKEYFERQETVGKSIMIKWFAEKEINDYIKFVMEIDFLILGVEDIEIEQDGLKSKANKGEIEMKINAYLLKDYEDSWAKNPFMTFLRETYDKFIIRSRIETCEDDLYNETYKFVNEIKAFLELHKF